MGIIYVITNNINGKQYVGLDRNDNKRWKDHRRRASIDAIQLIDRKMYEYGVDNFDCSIVYETENLDELKQKEIDFIKKLNTYVGNGYGYNLTFGGDGSNGFKIPEESINKGQKHYMYGKKMPEEQKRKISESMKLHRAKSINPFTAPEVREKISSFAKTRTGKNNPNYKHGRRAQK